MKIITALVVGAVVGSLLTADSRPQVEARRFWSCEVDGELMVLKIGGVWREAVCRIPEGAMVGKAVVR